MPLIDNSSVIIDVNPTTNLDNYTLQDLLKLRADIDRRLPVKSIRDIDLSSELVLQFQATQELQNEVVRDAETPANQKAQTLNATAAVLGQIAKLQTEIYTSERLKKIEAKLIEALNTLPAETQEAFLLVYQEVLGEENPHA